MKTKLTLSIDRDLVQFAHKQARVTKNSVSSMISEYLLQRKAQVEKTTRSNVANMVGALKQYPIDDSKEALRSLYAQKYSG